MTVVVALVVSNPVAFHTFLHTRFFGQQSPDAMPPLQPLNPNIKTGHNLATNLLCLHLRCMTALSHLHSAAMCPRSCSSGATSLPHKSACHRLMHSQCCNGFVRMDNACFLHHCFWHHNWFFTWIVAAVLQHCIG